MVLPSLGNWGLLSGTLGRACLDLEVSGIVSGTWWVLYMHCLPKNKPRAPRGTLTRQHSPVSCHNLIPAWASLDLLIISFSPWHSSPPENAEELWDRKVIFYIFFYICCFHSIIAVATGTHWYWSQLVRWYEGRPPKCRFNQRQLQYKIKLPGFKVVINSRKKRKLIKSRWLHSWWSVHMNPCLI